MSTVNLTKHIQPANNGYSNIIVNNNSPSVVRCQLEKVRHVAQKAIASIRSGARASYRFIVDKHKVILITTGVILSSVGIVIAGILCAKKVSQKTQSKPQSVPATKPADSTIEKPSIEIDNTDKVEIGHSDFCVENTEWSIKDLGTLESDSSEAVWINDKCEVLGKYQLKGKHFVFLWSKEKGIRTIELPQNAHLKKLNNSGQILFCIPVERYENSRRICSSRSCIWDPAIGIIEASNDKLGEFHANDMNDNGVLIGCFFKDGKHSPPHIWDNGKIIELEHLHSDSGISATSSSALFINNNLDIIGHSQRTVVPKGKPAKKIQVAVAWKFSTKWKAKEIFPDDGCSWVGSSALGINNQGAILCKKGNSFFFGDLNKDLDNAYFTGTPRSFNNSNSFLSGLYCIHDITKKSSDFKVNDFYFSDCIPTNDPENIWTRIKKVSSVNSHGYAVGTISTWYAETHAVIFIPDHK